MSYWTFKKEKIQKDWHSFVSETIDWWKKNGFVVALFAPIPFIFSGVLFVAYNIWLGVSLLITGIAFLVGFAGYIIISSEIDDYRELKETRSQNKKAVTSITSTVKENRE